MRDSSELSLHESILLLALREETGKAVFGWWKHAMCGAVVAELLDAGRIEIESGKKSFINVLDERPTGDAALDMSLRKIMEAKRRAQAPTWITRLANMRELKHTVARALCAKGVLMEDEERVLIFFKQKVYPEINPRPERDLMRRINEVVLNTRVTPDAGTRTLIAVAHAAELMKKMIDKQDWKTACDRLDQIVESDPIGCLTRDAVKAAQAAAVVGATSGSSVVVSTG